MTHRGDVVLVNNSRETFTSDRSGAIATCLWELCRAGARAGISPHVVTRAGAGARYEWPHVRQLGAAPARGPLGTRIGRARRRITGWARPDQEQYAHEVLGVLRELGARVIVVNNDPELAVHLNHKLDDVRVVHWFHNLEVASDRFRRQVALDSGLALAAVSDYLSRAVEGVYQLTPLRVVTARNGVDSARFAPRTGSNVPPTIGYVGRLAVEKGVDVLLEACLLVRADGAQFRLQLVGDTNWGFSDGGSYGACVVELAAKLTEAGVEVARLGHVDRERIPQVLAACDLHVVPSRWDDPMPLTMLEGMAAGLAVVGSASGGIPEALAGVGRVVPRENPRALADALRDLLTDRELRADYGQRARERAATLTWDETFASLLAAGHAGR